MIRRKEERFNAGSRTCGGCMCAGWISGCENDVLKSSGESVQFDVGSAPALAQVGGSVKQVLASKWRRARDHFSRCRRNFVVLSSVCTHERARWICRGIAIHKSGVHATVRDLTGQQERFYADQLPHRCRGSRVPMTVGHRRCRFCFKEREARAVDKLEKKPISGSYSDRFFYF